jgi:hypothetical protein
MPNLKDMRQTFRLGLAAAQRDGCAVRTALYKQCLKNVNQKLREAKRGTIEGNA